MNTSAYIRVSLLGVLVALVISPIRMTAQNELVPAPNAVQLRRIWTQQGRPLRADEYGYNVWGGTDLTGDGIADFAVYRNTDNTWLFYAGGNPPDTVPFLIIDSVGSVPPYCADFFDDGSLLMLLRDGSARVVDGLTRYYDRVRLFEVRPEGLASEPTTTYDHGAQEPPVERFLREFFVLDVNNDSVEDLAVSLGGLRTGDTRESDLTRQIWFYLGGPEFGIDTPTVIIRDTSEYGTPDNWEVRFGDFDGDGRTDMVCGGSYPTGGPMLRFWWGDENSPGSWSTRPADRDLQLVDGVTGIRDVQRLGFFRLDGDDIPDLVGYTGGEAAGTYVYLSTRGNPRTRAFSVEQADVQYPHIGFSTTPMGYLNDDRHRYEMLPLGGSVEPNQIARLAVSGSVYGPDHDYEAWYAPGLDGLANEFIFQRGAAVGDVTGDSYDDFLISDPTYGPLVNTGIAFLLTGGPDIPLDDTTLNVRSYPVAGDPDGLFLWPNPVGEELHIAWKGNLKRIPVRFAVYSWDGREIVSGPVDPYRGSALWTCATVPPGRYLLIAYDNTGRTIGSAPVLKQ